LRFLLIFQYFLLSFFNHMQISLLLFFFLSLPLLSSFFNCLALFFSHLFLAYIGLKRQPVSSLLRWHPSRSLNWTASYSFTICWL
jgi:hypothetical protein